MTAAQLDRVSAARPIFVFHANAHLATVNSALMQAEGITADVDTPGVVKGADGEPIGELQELQAMIRARTAIGMLMRAADSADGIRNMGRACVNAGVTTFTDLGAMLFRSDVVARWRAVTAEDGFPARASVAYGPLLGGPQDPSEVAAIVKELAPQSTDKLRFGQVKLVMDGSIQGFTACVGWPGYLSGKWLRPGCAQTSSATTSTTGATSTATSRSARSGRRAWTAVPQPHVKASVSRCIRTRR